MENFTFDAAFKSVTLSSLGVGVTRHSVPLWRPWTGGEDGAAARKAHSWPQNSDSKHLKPLHVTHPVKLYWPKSRCFDYLYQAAEALLRIYPVQATICPYEDSSSDEESDDEEEHTQKEQN